MIGELEAAGGDPRVLRHSKTGLLRFSTATTGQLLSRNKFALVCETFGYRGKYAWLAHSDLTWVRVKSVEGIGTHPVYDMNVPDTGCFFGNTALLHNTLLTYLAPTVLGSKRPILFLPAKLRDVKTPREFARLSLDWRAPPSLRIVSYETLSRDYGDETRVGDHGQPLGILDLADPDLIMDDECHRFKNQKSACTRKMNAFMRTHPTVVHLDTSGSVTKDQIQDYAHILEWTHKNASPVPRTYGVLKDWGGALNVKVNDEDRVEVGALLELATPEERATLDRTTAARRGFRRRLLETPGVVGYDKPYTGASLCIEECGTPAYSAKTEEIFQTFRLDGLLPNGEGTSGGLANWRVERQLARGFFLTWDPPPPTPWKEARSEWYAASRYAIKESDKNGSIDSEKQVALACVRTHDPRYQTPMWKDIRRAYEAWIAQRDAPGAFKINTVAYWHDDAAWKLVAGWMSKNKGLVWVEHIEFAERLARETGAPYFHEEGLDADGRAIEDARPDRDGSIIVSIDSNREGRNLQEFWSNNLFTVLPKGADACEQALGRTHRSGQTEDEVTADVAVWSRADGSAWLSILESSKYIIDTNGLPAKVLYADTVMPTREDLDARVLETARF